MSSLAVLVGSGKGLDPRRVATLKRKLAQQAETKRTNTQPSYLQITTAKCKEELLVLETQQKVAERLRGTKGNTEASKHELQQEVDFLVKQIELEKERIAELMCPVLSSERSSAFCEGEGGEEDV